MAKNSSQSPETKADTIEGMFKPIIPVGFFGEQYTNDVALIFKPLKIIAQCKTKYQKIDVIDTETYGRIMFIDNLLMKTDKDGHIINEMIVHPVMLTGRKKKKVLVIGGGEGFTATELLKYPYVDQIDIVDIDGEAVEFYQKIYPEKTKCFANKKVNIIIEDGLKYLKTTKEVYDAIFTTPTDPLTISDPLFVNKYYKAAFSRLTNDGIFQTDSYMPYYQYGNVDYAYICKLLGKYFPISKVYTTTIPSFPGGLFAFTLASKKYDPEKDLNYFDFNIETNYYNKDLHFASFKLPQFMIDKLAE
jgi:spermidine synthase